MIRTSRDAGLDQPRAGDEPGKAAADEGEGHVVGLRRARRRPACRGRRDNARTGPRSRRYWSLPSARRRLSRSSQVLAAQRLLVDRPGGRGRSECRSAHAAPGGSNGRRGTAAAPAAAQDSAALSGPGLTLCRAGGCRVYAARIARRTHVDDDLPDRPAGPPDRRPPLPRRRRACRTRRPDASRAMPSAGPSGRRCGDARRRALSHRLADQAGGLAGGADAGRRRPGGPGRAGGRIPAGAARAAHRGGSERRADGARPAAPHLRAGLPVGDRRCVAARYLAAGRPVDRHRGAGCGRLPGAAVPPAAGR